MQIYPKVVMWCVCFQYLQLPKKEEVNINFRSYWNAGVFYTFDFIANIPSKVVGLKDYMVDFASSPSTENKPEASKIEESAAVLSEEAAVPPVTPEVSSPEKLQAQETQ